MTYINVKVGVHENLEIKVLLSLIANLQRCLQSILGESDTVYQAKLKRPSLAELLAQHCMRQSKVQLHSQIGLGLTGSLGRFG